MAILPKWWKVRSKERCLEVWTCWVASFLFRSGRWIGVERGEDEAMGDEKWPLFYVCLLCCPWSVLVVCTTWEKKLVWLVIHALHKRAGGPSFDPHLWQCEDRFRWFRMMGVRSSETDDLEFVEMDPSGRYGRVSGLTVLTWSVWVICLSDLAFLAFLGLIGFLWSCAVRWDPWQRSF